MNSTNGIQGDASPARLVDSFLAEVAADTRPICFDMFGSGYPNDAEGRRRLARKNVDGPWRKPKVFVAIHEPRHGWLRVFAGRAPWAKLGAMRGQVVDAVCVAYRSDLYAALRTAIRYVEEHKAEGATLYLDARQESCARDMLRADRARHRRSQ